MWRLMMVPQVVLITLRCSLHWAKCPFFSLRKSRSRFESYKFAFSQASTAKFQQWYVMWLTTPNALLWLFTVQYQEILMLNCNATVSVSEYSNITSSSTGINIGLKTDDIPECQFPRFQNGLPIFKHVCFTRNVVTCCALKKFAVSCQPASCWWLCSISFSKLATFCM